MSKFYEWFSKNEAAFEGPRETFAHYAERTGREAWNAVLDELEGLVKELQIKGEEISRNSFVDGEHSGIRWNRYVS